MDSELKDKYGLVKDYKFMVQFARVISTVYWGLLWLLACGLYMKDYK